MNDGLSPARLGRLHDVMSGHVERGVLPGLVTMVWRHGEAHVDVIGTSSFDGPPMRRDSIFRITSMTKPVTAVATMILVEECRLRLDDAVDDLLPELADRRVLIRPEGPLGETVPADRPITVRDLLTFRWGFGLLVAPPGSTPIQRATEELGIMTGPPLPATPHPPDEWMRRLGTLPLVHQPGYQWMYNSGSHVLGVLVARACGQPFETFLRERIFEPLGMGDTAFTVAPDRLGRLVSCYDLVTETGELVVLDGADDSRWSRPPAFPDGAAGLVSTVDDYLAFGQMLLRRGRHGVDRLLSRPSVEAMTTDQLTVAQRQSAGPILDGRGWGFGTSIVRQRDGVAAVPGRFGWDGGYGTLWASDPAEDLVAILMTQRLFDAETTLVHQDFWTSVYASIDD